MTIINWEDDEFFHTADDETGNSSAYRKDGKKTPTLVSDAYGVNWVVLP